MTTTTRPLDAAELESLYTLVAEAIGRVGTERAPLLLATLALDLMTKGIDPDQARDAIERAERLSGI